MAAPREEGDERRDMTPEEEREATRKIFRGVSAGARRFQALVEAERDRLREREEGK